MNQVMKRQKIQIINRSYFKDLVYPDKLNYVNYCKDQVG